VKDPIVPIFAASSWSKPAYHTSEPESKLEVQVTAKSLRRRS
jgi:hypothetical protein